MTYVPRSKRKEIEKRKEKWKKSVEQQELRAAKIQTMLENLKRDIDDERETSTGYSLKAGALEKMGFPKEAEALRKIAKDQYNHLEELQDIIGAITAEITK